MPEKFYSAFSSCCELDLFGGVTPSVSFACLQVAILSKGVSREYFRHTVLAEKKCASAGENTGKELMSKGKPWEVQEYLCQLWRSHQEIALIPNFLVLH